MDKKNLKERPDVIPGILLFFRRLNKEIGENEYLLHLRKNTHFHDGEYSVPGGHIERYETYTQCAIREAEEETNLKLRKQDLCPVHIIYRQEGDEIRPDLCFLIEKWEGKVINKESQKHGPFEWYLVSKLPTKIVPYVKEAIRHIEKKVFYSEFGF